MRTVRLSGTFVTASMRIASIIAADPAALSVAPVEECQESKCAPSITSSSALSEPRISPTTLNIVGLGWNVFLTSASSVTGIPLASVRAICPYCSAGIVIAGSVVAGSLARLPPIV